MTADRVPGQRPDGRDNRRVVAGAVLAGVPRGHIEREARALAACDGKPWYRLVAPERDAYRAEAAGIAVGVHVV